ncbi:MAG: lipid-A-disaccharide synthase, partial [Robiginitomaculum sp.]|nr:lipid-A-disaccharide synthase [Robiginitomaculum sp.]
MTSPHIYIVAAEKSGDELGAGLVRQLRKQTDGKITLSAIGGSALAAEGLDSAIDIRPLSILGFVEGLKSYPIIMERVAQAVDIIIASNADAAVLIDSWGFMARVAKRLKKRGYKGQIIKYVAPQVWAMREGRAKILAGLVDHLLTIHSFDAPYFTKHGLNTIYVGNPIFDEDYRGGDGSGLRKEYNIPDETLVLVMLFGSRLSEIQRLAEPF